MTGLKLAQKCARNAPEYAWAEWPPTMKSHAAAITCAGEGRMYLGMNPPSVTALQIATIASGRSDARHRNEACSRHGLEAASRARSLAADAACVAIRRPTSPGRRTRAPRAC